MGTGLYALQLYEEGAPPSVDVTGTSRDLAAMFSAILPAAPLRAGAWGQLAALAGAGAAERGAAPGWGARGIRELGPDCATSGWATWGDQSRIETTPIIDRNTW